MKKNLSCLMLVLALLVVTNIAAQNKPSGSQPYHWKSVRIGGGGFVDGIIFHPKEKGLCYARTDMGGAYRRDAATSQWVPLLDWVTYRDANLMGVESIALDPNDANRVYMACGTYTNSSTPNGAILWSDNKGQSFHRVNMPVKFGGNENGRGNGERMAVDPNNGNIIFLGTRHDGLWKSIDAGRSWNPVASFPNVTDSAELSNPARFWQGGSGIIFVIYDAATGKAGQGSSTIYAGVSLMGRSNLLVSNDGGQTWGAVAGQPLQYRPTHAVLSPDGNLYITYGTNPGPMPMNDGAVWKYNTKTSVWTDVTPDKPDSVNNSRFGYAAVALDAAIPNVVIVSSFGRSQERGGDEIFCSQNGGTSWSSVFATGNKFDYSLAPYIQHTGIHWLFDIEIDPFNPDHVMFTTGYGGHEMFDFTNTNKKQIVTWQVMNPGIEETVALELLSPASGPQLYSAIGDYCGFAHTNLDEPQPEGCYTNPHFANTNGIACASLKPVMVVRVGIASQHTGGTNIGYSLDAGKSWQPCQSLPDGNSRLGFIAVSALGSSWIWTPEHQSPFVTFDKGVSWRKIENLPVDTRVIADCVNDKIFYAISLYAGLLYISNDGGQTFSQQTFTLSGGLPLRPEWQDGRGDSRGGQDRLYATPGKEGDLWLAAWDGLYHSTHTGKDFVKMPGVTQMNAFGFGKEAPHARVPALYMVGVVNGVYGIFRSDDCARSWARINDDNHQWGLLLHITGDPKKYGRVYVGTHGRGIVYGDIPN